jgi:UDP-2,4-diacetamido-2,4,6-trideoxy-beta-L-altropyranose hydrolase
MLRTSTQHLLIRADADDKIGAGHVMRCLALAQAWRARCRPVTFVSRCDSHSMRQRIRDEGMGLVGLSHSHSTSEDLETTLALIKEIGPSWLVTDGYHFTLAYQEIMRQTGVHLLCVDDYQNLPYYQADIILNQNIGAERLSYPCGQDSVLLLGSRYILLRQEFLDFGTGQPKAKDTASQVLVTLGGADPENITRRVLVGLKQLKHSRLEVDVVVGPVNRHTNVLLEEMQAGNGQDGAGQVRIHLHQNPSMRALMTRAHLALSAAGSTCWELAFLGVPMAIVTIADNQKAIGPALEKAGAAIHLGWPNEWNEQFLVEAVGDLLQHPARLQAMGLAGQRLVDGRGADRVVSLMDHLAGDVDIDKSSVRQARKGDCLQLWRLSNDPEVRENSFQTELIPLEEHIFWFEQRFASPDTIFFVLDVEGVIAAQIRYDNKGRVGCISYAVAAPFRGRGLGRKIIDWTLPAACRKMDLTHVQGVTRYFNQASIKTFLKAGFNQQGETMVEGKGGLVFIKACPPAREMRL